MWNDMLRNKAIIWQMTYYHTQPATTANKRRIMMSAFVSVIYALCLHTDIYDLQLLLLLLCCTTALFIYLVESIAVLLTKIIATSTSLLLLWCVSESFVVYINCMWILHFRQNAQTHTKGCAHGIYISKICTCATKSS